MLGRRGGAVRSKGIQSVDGLTQRVSKCPTRPTRLQVGLDRSALGRFETPIKVLRKPGPDLVMGKINRCC